MDRYCGPRISLRGGFPPVPAPTSGLVTGGYVKLDGSAVLQREFKLKKRVHSPNPFSFNATLEGGGAVLTEKAVGKIHVGTYLLELIVNFAT